MRLHRIVEAVSLKALLKKCVAQTKRNYGLPDSTPVIASAIAYDRLESKRWNERIYRVPMVIQDLNGFFIKTLHGDNGQARMEEEKIFPSSLKELVETVEKYLEPKLQREIINQIFEHFRPQEAGEIDWRPTETIPEDFY